jgi:hypothetical protein
LGAGTFAFVTSPTGQNRAQDWRSAARALSQQRVYRRNIE